MDFTEQQLDAAQKRVQHFADMTGVGFGDALEFVISIRRHIDNGLSVEQAIERNMATARWFVNNAARLPAREICTAFYADLRAAGQARAA